MNFIANTSACSGGVCDVLIFYAMENSAFFAGTGTAEIFVDGALLGSDTEACCVESFHSASSIWTEGTPISFTGINAGDAVTLDLTLSGGSIGWSGSPTPSVFLGNGTCGGCANSNFDQTVSSIEIITPEPPAFWLPALGFSILSLRRRWLDARNSRYIQHQEQVTAV